MDEKLKQKVALFLEELVAYGYEWYSVNGILSAGAYSTEEEVELVAHFTRAEKLLEEFDD